MRELLLLGVLMAGFSVAASGQDRPSISLDGVWSFRFSPDDRGTGEKWFQQCVSFPERLRVPGSWNGQGVGERSEKLNRNASGIGWYRRSFTLPASWKGRRVWLVIGGAHRRVTAYVDGRAVLDEADYPVAKRVDITERLRSGSKHTLALAVDSRRGAGDPLMGSFDTVDFLYAEWGGIFGSVRLEATGGAYIDDLFVQPDPLRKRATLEVSCSGSHSGEPGLTLDYVVRRWIGHSIGEPLASGSSALDLSQPLKVDVSLPNAPLWTPDTPNMLVVEAKLRRGDTLLDRRQVRFGLRRLEVRGADFMLNGDKFFLRGYGDDWTFPNEIAGLTSVEAWKKYLRMRKAFGFNGVRHHSCMPPDAYLDAADEVGMFIQPELPIAYQNFYEEAGAAREVYPRVWERYIRQMRNHPSVFAWCMGNELSNGLPISADLCRNAKELDPTRPVIDTDGLFSKPSRNTLDYLSVQFQESIMPWGRSTGKYRLDWGLEKPVIVHEMANISVLPDPADIPKYIGAVRPFWLEEMESRVRDHSLQERLPQMLEASRKLQASLLKLNMEAARMSPVVKGYHQWLFRDYWAQSTGFVNQFDEPRLLTPVMARDFNGPAVLLWNHDRVSFRAGEGMRVSLQVSDFRPLNGPALFSGNKSERFRYGQLRFAGTRFPITPSQTAEVVADDPRNRGLFELGSVSVTAPAVKAPRQLNLEVEVSGLKNSWPVWVFPKVTEPIPAGVQVVRRLTPKLMDALEQGASILLLDPRNVFPTLQASFKPAWWHGDDADHVYGNMILPHPAMAGFPAEGYCDLQMYGLMNNRPVVLLDEVPGRIEPIVWCLDLPWKMRRKAYLFEARVGKGRLLVSGFDFSAATRERDPAVAWLYAKLVRYAEGSAFQPASDLPASWLRERLSSQPALDLTGVTEGFLQALESTEPESTWHSYRDDDTPIYVVRQTDGNQRITWQTAPVTTGAAQSGTVTFAWAGGMGWVTQPGGGHFTLSVKDIGFINFPFSQQNGFWKSQDGRMTLRYVPRRQVDVDSFGIFVLTIPSSMARPGRPLTLTVTATAQGSRRWFGLNAYPDVVKEESD